MKPSTLESYKIQKNISFSQFKYDMMILTYPKIVCFIPYSTSANALFLRSSILSHGIIFWGNSYYSKNILKIQKTIIRATMSSGRRDSCHELFRQLNILLLKSQYIFSLLLFIIKNTDQHLSNTEIRDVHTRHNSNLHLPLANLTLYQKRVFYTGSRIYNHLLSIMKD